MSPLPPLAIPGLPVVLMAMRPSGWAMSVRHPFSTRVTACRVAKSRATAFPVGLHLRDAHPRQPGHFAGVGSQYQQPSAAVQVPGIRGQGVKGIGIDDHGDLRPFQQTQEELDGFLLLPHTRPDSDDRFLFQNGSRRAGSRFRLEISPLAPSSKATVISSGVTAATVGKIDSATAAVTRPAPVRKAASELIEGAPDLPLAPPITRTCPNCLYWNRGNEGGPR